MNQILVTEKKNHSSNTNMKDIVLFFAIALIIFGLIVAGIGIYKFIKNRPKSGEIAKINKPEATINQDGDNIVIVAKYDEGIAKIVYNWDDGDINDINIGGKTYIEKAIELPNESVGVLNLQVIGVDGSILELSNEITVGDKSKPNIDWTVTTVISAVATDDEGLAYLSYKWNDEEEIIVNPDENDNKQIKTEITIKRGRNELTVKAVDIAGNVQTKSRVFQGINEPQISMIRYGDKIEVSVSHDMGLKKIIYTINGENYTYDETSEDYNATQDIVTKTFSIKPGRNNITVKAYSNEDSEKTQEAIATYNP